MKSRLCSREETFNRQLLEVFDETLSCIGAPARESIYYHLENKFNIKKDEIPRRVEECTGALKAIFGLAALPLEARMMDQLYKRISSDVECCAPENFELPVYVEMLRSRYLLDSKNDTAFSVIDDVVAYARLVKV